MLFLRALVVNGVVKATVTGPIEAARLSARPCPRSIPLPSHPVAHIPLAAGPPPLPPLLLPPSPPPRPPLQATLRVSGPSPRAGGRPADLDPPAAASSSSSSVAASGGSFYPLLRSEASGSPHSAVSMSPTAISPCTCRRRRRLAPGPGRVLIGRTKFRRIFLT